MIILVGDILLLGVGSQQEELGNEDDCHDKAQSNGDGIDLGVENNETAPGSLAEGGPGIADGNVTPTTNNGGLNGALEGSVKGQDGVLALGKQRSLNSDQDDVSGNDDKDGGEDGGDEDDRHLPAGTIVLGQLHGLAHANLGKVEVEGDSKHVWNPARELSSEPVQGDSLPGGVESALEGRQTLPEVQRGGGGNDDMDPGGAELDEGQRGQEGGDRGEGSAQHGREDAHEEAGQEALGDEAEEAAEVCAEAAVGLEEAVDGAEGRGDGVRRVIVTDGLVGAIGVAGVIAESNGLVGGRVLVFDNGQDGVDVLECVVQLKRKKMLAHIYKTHQSWTEKTRLTRRMRGRKMMRSKRKTSHDQAGSSRCLSSWPFSKLRFMSAELTWVRTMMEKKKKKTTKSAWPIKNLITRECT